MLSRPSSGAAPSPRLRLIVQPHNPAEGGWKEAGTRLEGGLSAPGYGVTGGAVPSPPLVGRRRRTNQTIPTTRTAAARMPKAIQPHCVLVLSSLFDAAAATAAGFTPVVVVVELDVCGDCAAV
jgi:hypothetical protein